MTESSYSFERHGSLSLAGIVGGNLSAKHESVSYKRHEALLETLRLNPSSIHPENILYFNTASQDSVFDYSQFIQLECELNDSQSDKVVLRERLFRVFKSFENEVVLYNTLYSSHESFKGHLKSETADVLKSLHANRSVQDTPTYLRAIIFTYAKLEDMLTSHFDPDHEEVRSMKTITRNISDVCCLVKESDFQNHLSLETVNHTKKDYFHGYLELKLSLIKARVAFTWFSIRDHFNEDTSVQYLNVDVTVGGAIDICRLISNLQTCNFGNSVSGSNSFSIIPEELPSGVGIVPYKGVKVQFHFIFINKRPRLQYNRFVDEQSLSIGL